MKRILSLFLMITLLFTSLSFLTVVHSANNTYDSEQADLLYALDVLDHPKLTDKNVTRAQFVKYAMKLAGIPLSPYNGTEFIDVPQTHADYNYIMSAVDFRLISIADNFRPEDTIAPTEALKIIVNLLGYDFMAEAKGGYPAGYLHTANTIELSKGIDTSMIAMTEYDVCTLLYNALKVHLPEISYTGAEASEYRIGTSTILNKYRGIMEINGIVDGVSYYSEHDASGLGEDKISINGTIYNTGELNCDMLFGYDVVAYYDETSKRLISCTPSDTNRVVSIYAEDIESFENGTYVYTDKNSNTRNVSVNMNTTIFFNGRLFDYNPSNMIPETGSLTFVSPSGSGTFSTLYIKSYKTIVVKKAYYSDEYMIIDKFLPENNVLIDPDETELLITDQNGNEIGFSSIIAGDVVNAAVSADGKFVELICARDEFLGTYSGYNADYIEVDGTQYRLTPALKDKVGDIISLGKQAIFRLDVDFRVADIIPSAGIGEDVGYLVIGRFFKSGMTSRLMARILNLDGNIYDYDFAEAFSVNDKAYKDFEEAYASLKSPDYNSIVCGVVKFTVNDEGKIKSLVYPDKYGGNGGLYVTGVVDNATKYHKFSKSFYSIGRNIICDSNLKVFKVPNPIYSVGNIDDEQFAIVEPSFVTGATAEGSKLEGYTTIENNGMSQYLLMQKIADDNSAESAIIGNETYMVSELNRAIVNEEEREILKLCNTSNPTTKPLVVYSKNENNFSADGVKPGDIIRISKNENNIVRALTHVYKKGESTLADGSYTIDGSGLPVSELNIAMTIPYRFRSQVLDVVPATASLATVSESDLEPRYLPLTKVFKYDEKMKQVVEVAVDEIKDYITFGNDKDTIICHMQYESLVTVFIVSK